MLRIKLLNAELGIIITVIKKYFIFAQCTKKFFIPMLKTSKIVLRKICQKYCYHYFKQNALLVC